MSKKLGLGALIGIIFLVGCTNRQPVPEAMQAPETGQNVGEANTPLINKNKEMIDEVKAKAIALAEVPNSIVTKTSFDGDEYIPNYEVDVAAEGYEYEFEIDARDGTILKMKKNLID